jgi:SNF2 family DNA or RNA helicase
MRKDLIAWVGQHQDEAIVAPVMVAQFMRLQQFADTYATLPPGSDRVEMMEPSAKLDRVMEILEGNEGAIVVWTQFKQLVYMLVERCRKAGISILTYTGDNRDTRGANVASFAAGGARVFAGTISSGGVGVDGLQYGSSTCIFLDRLWDPGLNEQAEDRLHRDGQKAAVQVIDIMARSTVDRGRKQRLELKWSWIKQLLDNQV